MTAKYYFFTFILFEGELEENSVCSILEYTASDNKKYKTKYYNKEILKDSGKISHEQAIEKSEKEFEKFRVKQDMQYISSMDKMYQRYLEENNNK